MAQHNLIRVAVPVPLRQLFDYLPVAGPLPEPGCRCEIDFGNRRLTGMVWEVVPPGDSDHDPRKLRPLRQVIDDQPVLDSDLRELCQRAAQYYQHPIGEVLQTALPVLLRQNAPAERQGELVWRLTARGRFADPAQLARAPRQQQALVTLAEHPRGLSRPMLTSLGLTSPPLRALEKKGWAELVQEQPAELTDRTANPLAEPHLAATPEQDAAIRAINASQHFAPFLLDGVTGSGKTEVYLQAMAHQLTAGRQVLVLVPEIGLTPQTIRRFRTRFSVPVTVLHSGLSDRERLKAWCDARDGQARIVLGTRSAIFTPLRHPGLIIVDEAHDNSFKQQDGFRYSARDLAVWRAQLLDIPVVLGTATPALETLQQAESGRYRALRLTHRAGEAKPPVIQLEDCRGLPADTPLSARSLDALGTTLKANRQALVFINRRGYAPMLLCQDCDWQSECDRCDAHMTWHRAVRELRCHHCDHRRPVPARCPQCGSQHLRDMGAGTEKLESLLRKQFPDTRLIRIDRDTTRRKGSLDASLEEIQRGGAALLVGTQMLAKGHHFSELDLAVMLDADAGFMSADFRGPEQAAQLILQVAGRTGREDRTGRLLIQTRQPDNPLLQLLCQGNYHRFAEQLLSERRQTGLPPFGFLALVRAESLQPQPALTLLQEASETLPLDSGLQLLGPIPAPMERRQGRYRSQLLLLAPTRGILHRHLPALLDALYAHPLSRKCRWHLDVDPTDLL
ncbi:replication restart DNA helicase PriA [Isoalcanivorax pacificus W11-5]|uniref:Replication restart protein PriA n=1 Tax=Isoalcanivorax pacificus W11-5 TaxID=391936 RepID=A0A0B4XK05_9GAMM|nr:primosomal protein N' [Isoalcanivorax pacificus]AJD46757.1 replication restart DNA helicase PriA [Isoalcanivorax pacificus W11-5]